VDCGWRYNLCSGAATAGSIACHGSCDIATVGLGIPACIEICGMMEVYALVVCADIYCPGVISPN